MKKDEIKKEPPAQNGSNSTLIANDKEKQAFWQAVRYSIDDLLNVEPKRIKNGFIVETGINVFIARTGSGKTHLAYTVCMGYLREGKKIYYLDFDNSDDLPRDRGFPNAVVQEGLQDNFIYLNSVHYLRWAETCKKSCSYYAFLKDYIRCVEDRSIFVVDSIQDIIDVNDPNKTTEFMRFLRNHSNLRKITFICIHHISRSTGQSKGHTQIVDMSDSAYKVKAKVENNEVVSWSLVADKQRYKTMREVTVKLLDDFNIEVEDIAIQDEKVLAILRSAVSIIRKNPGIKQSDLRKAIKEKFERVGKDKILSILKEYEQKDLFMTETGEKNTKYYTVNEKSPYLKLLFDTELSEIKQKLYNTCKALQAVNGDQIAEIRLERPGGVVLIFKSISSILNSICQMSDTDAEELLQILSERYQEPREPTEVL